MFDMKPIYIPALTGQFANWRYFQVVMSVEHIVEVIGYDEAKPVHRIKTVAEVEEIYSRKGLGEKLQRLFDERRLEPIKKYLTQQQDKYVNNLTVALFGGSPEWLPIGLSTSALLEIDEQPGEDFWEQMTKAFGVIKLSGNEIIFVLDGQHRIMGLREAIKEKKEIGKEQIAITFISHDDTEEGRKTTRRLFTTINRHAKPVSLGENILLDEDDLSSIIARDVIEKYKYFSGKDIIALNKTADIKVHKDRDKFSTVIQLWNINEMLIDPSQVYPKYTGGKDNLVRIRPSDHIIEEYRQKVFAFWDSFFIAFPKSLSFVEQTDLSARDNGGPISLRPIGQTLYCAFYKQMLKLGREDGLSLMKRIPDDLADPFWHYVLSTPVEHNIIGSYAYARMYLYHNLGLPITKKQQKSILEKYRRYKADPNAELPDMLIKD